MDLKTEPNRATLLINPTLELVIEREDDDSISVKLCLNSPMPGFPNAGAVKYLDQEQLEALWEDKHGQ